MAGSRKSVNYSTTKNSGFFSISDVFPQESAVCRGTTNQRVPTDAYKLI